MATLLSSGVPLLVPQTLLPTAGRQKVPAAPAETPAAGACSARASTAGAPVACPCVDPPSANFGDQRPRTAVMEGQANAAQASLGPRVKASLVLGTESFAISPESGILSEQLAMMKEKSMVILKEYITKHNAPNDVPDEPIEGESDDEGEAVVKNPPKKSKKQK